MQELVKIINNQVVVSSRQVAESFEKEHKDVLESIRGILEAENSAAKFFHETTYENRGKQYPEYLMNRDGFSILAMGFTGKKALAWKMKYINVFNEMEQELTGNIPKTFSEALRLAADQADKIEYLKTENAVSKQIICELQPKATYYDMILQNKSLLSVSKIAKDYGKSAIWLNNKLHEFKVQFRQSDIWLLYQKYADKGYTQTKTHPIDVDKSSVHTYWTQKGRIFIYELFKQKGILPLIEMKN